MARRYWAKVNRKGPVPDGRPDLGPCWLWTSPLNHNGYGQFHAGKRMRRAHHISFELAGGVIPRGLGLDHLCSVRHCVRPSHLEAVPQRENNLRGPTNFAALNAAKTHCPQGHPYDAENTYVTPSGTRQCKECGRRSTREYLLREAEARNAGAPLKPVIHKVDRCPKGHPYDEANTCVVKTTGGRVCRTCARERMWAKRHPRE